MSQFVQTNGGRGGNRGGLFRGGRGFGGHRGGRGRGGRGGGFRGGRGGGGGGMFFQKRKTYSPEKSKKCSVCKEVDHKYRCPRCSVQYCSLKCFKDHKSKCLDDDLDIDDEFDDWGKDGTRAAGAVASGYAAASDTVHPALTHLAAYNQRLAVKRGEKTIDGEIELYSSSSSSEDEGDEKSEKEEEIIDQNPDRMKRKELKCLASSQKLKELLTNPHLRNLVLEVDEADDKNAIMQAAMQEPLFLELADVCLAAVNSEKR